MSSWREERALLEITLECESCLLELLHRSRIFWPRLFHLGAKLLLPGLCDYLLWCFSCSTAYGSHKRKSQLREYLSARMNQREGLLAEGGMIPLPLREPGKSLSLWRERRACDCHDSLKQFVKKVLLNSKSSADDTGLCWCFSACDSLRTSKGKYLLSPVMEAVSFHHASQGWSQTGRVFFEINPGLVIIHRLLKCCPWQSASLRCWLTEIDNFCICELSMISLLGIVRRCDWTLCLYSACSYWSTLIVRVLL